MKLWRLVRAPFLALDGAGSARFGTRYASPGRPMVNFTSEAGLAVLVALRYLPRDLTGIPDDFQLGWTEISAEPEQVPETADTFGKTAFIDTWLDSKRSLLAKVPSAVLPEAYIIMMNPLHPDAQFVAPLTVRPFSFTECLHQPPMLDKYSGTSALP